MPIPPRIPSSVCSFGTLSYQQIGNKVALSQTEGLFVNEKTGFFNSLGNMKTPTTQEQDLTQREGTTKVLEWDGTCVNF